MKNNNAFRKQRGFFDLGLGLGLMLVFGGTAAVIDENKDLQQQFVKPATERVDQKIITVKNDQE
jgi:hypothetical protein